MTITIKELPGAVKPGPGNTKDPYVIEKRGNKFFIIRTLDGEELSMHTSKRQAERRVVSLIQADERPRGPATGGPQVQLSQ